MEEQPGHAGRLAWYLDSELSGILFTVRETVAGEPLLVLGGCIGGQRHGMPIPVIVTPSTKLKNLTLNKGAYKASNK